MTTQTLTVNHLPVFMWNKLKLNHGTIQIGDQNIRAAEPSRSDLAADIAYSIVSQEDLEKILTEQYHIKNEKEFIVGGKTPIYNTQQFATGMGKEVDQFFLKNQIPAEIYQIPANRDLNEPILLKIECPDDTALLHSQCIIAEENSSATIIIDVSSAPGSSGAEMVGISTKIVVGQGAKIHLVKTQTMNDQSLYFDDIGVFCDDSASFDLTQIITGAKDSFVGCAVSQQGDSSIHNADIGYLCKGSQTLDINYVSLQRGQKTDSSINVNGVLKDSAKKLFRGTIDFRNGSSGSKGNERENILLLSPDVVNQTIPLILCEEEDVEGEHGATISQLSSDILFYMETRGIPKKTAEDILTKVRLTSISRLIPDQELETKVNRAIEEALK